MKLFWQEIMKSLSAVGRWKRPFKSESSKVFKPQIKHLTIYCQQSPTKKINISPKKNKFE